MVRTPQRSTSCMKGSSLNPCITASLWMSTVSSWSPILATPCLIRSSSKKIERWWQQLEAGQKHPEGSFKAINALAMAASYDPDPAQFLGIRLPVTFETCEVIEERWANWLRQDPVVAVESQGNNLRRLKALYLHSRRRAPCRRTPLAARRQKHAARHALRRHRPCCAPDRKAAASPDG